MEKVDCKDCKLSCYEKVGNTLVPRRCFIKRYLTNVYSQLLQGENPPAVFMEALREKDVSPSCVVYFPFQSGILKSTAAILMKNKISCFKALHSHYLVEVFVSKSEDDMSLSTMYAPFFLILHGLIPTPNRRLTDLLCEFMEYKFLSGIPFILFTITYPEPPIVKFIHDRGIKLVDFSKQIETENVF